MTSPCLYARLRRDLRVSAQPQGGCEIETPQGERYAFDPQTFALLQLFDGRRDCQTIAAEFNARFGTGLEPEEIERFCHEALANGLIELRGDLTEGPKAESARESLASDGDEDQGGDSTWVLFDPMPFLSWLAHLVAPFRLLFQAFVLSLFILVPIALYTLFDNQPLMELDLAQLRKASPYFWRLLLSLLVINLLRCLVQGTVIAYYGGKVSSFGIRLRFGIIPRFFIDKGAIKDLKREARLWVWGSNLLLRLGLIAMGALGWFIWRPIHLDLALYALILAHAALIGLLFVSLPVRNSDGYRLLMTWRGLPLATLKLAGFVLYARLRNRPLPTSISASQARRLLAYATVLGVFWALIAWRIFTHISQGLVASFPQIFGEATEALIILLVALLMLRWGWQRAQRLGWQGSSRPTPGQAVPAWELGRPSAAGEHRASGLQTTSEQAGRLVVLGLVILILLLPFPYRPGGPVVLLAPEQQAIQAPVAGRILRVLQRGGDGTLLAAGEPVAILLAEEIEQEAKALEFQIRQYEAILAQRQGELALRLAGARPESIAEARARVAQAQEEVGVAEQQLAIAKTSAIYSERELERIRDLPKGLISEIEVARVEKQAAIDRLRIPEQERVLQAKRQALAECEAQLALLLKGARPEEIEIARQAVAETEAALGRLRQALEYTRSRLSGTQLRMPFAGYLVEGHLQQKEGMYMAQGEHFATAQVRRRPVVELLLPESEIAALKPGSPAEVRLQAYPQRPLQGELVSIEPVGTASLTGQTFRLLIELEDEDLLLKPGMSGYGKVTSGTKPLYLQLVQPLLRFAQIEVWSWLP